MRKVKVCYAISSLCEGPTYVLYNIVQYIDFDKFEVDIITMTPEKETSIIGEFEKLPLRIHKLTIVNSLTPWMMGYLLRKKIIELKPDIVHVHCPRSRLLSPVIPRRCKKVETIHNYPDLPKVLYGQVKGTIVKWLSTKITSKMDLIIPCSESIGEKYDEMGICNTPIPNGCSMPEWIFNEQEKKHLRNQLGMDDSKTWFLFVGRFSEEKNPNVVIRAFEKLNNDKFGLMMLGNGRMWNRMKMHETDRICMPGFKHEVQKYLKASDFLISASDSEGMPNTVLEAMATGIPMLLSDIAPHREVLRKSHEPIGWTFDQKDALALLKLINRGLLYDANEMSKKIHMVFEKYYTAVAMSKKYQEEYLKLMK
jgi:glycosyltransferase involved in cell wall biosynthesis